MGVKIVVKTKYDMKGLNNFIKRYPKQTKSGRVGHFGNVPHMFSRHLTYAALSYIQQKGEGNIPSRPYMKIALQSPAFVKKYNDIVKQIVEDRAKDITTKSIRLQIKELAIDLKKVMMGVIETSSGLARNAPSTIKLKGFDKPLVETGNLVNDIEYQLIQDTSNHPIGYDSHERAV